MLCSLAQGLNSPLEERAQLVGTAALRRLGIFALGDEEGL
jgi:hypothetical protein